MPAESSKFFIVWKIVFKYLFYVSFGVAIFKSALFGLHNGFENLELTNVLMVIVIYTAGAALLSVIISLWAVIKDRDYKKS